MDWLCIIYWMIYDFDQYVKAANDLSAETDWNLRLISPSTLGKPCPSILTWCSSRQALPSLFEIPSQSPFLSPNTRTRPTQLFFVNTTCLRAWLMILMRIALNHRKYPDCVSTLWIVPERRRLKNWSAFSMYKVRYIAKYWLFPDSSTV